MLLASSLARLASPEIAPVLLAGALFAFMAVLGAREIQHGDAEPR